MIHTNKQEEKNITFLLDAFTDNLGHVSIPTTFFRHVDTTSEEFENGTLFLRLGLPSTLIGEIVHRKRSFSKTLLKTEKFEKGALRFG